MTKRDLSAFFSPKSIAIVGASHDTSTLRGRIPMQLLKGKYPGALWPVHPRETEIQGLKTYPSLKDLPGPLDLALIVIPSDKVIEAVEQAADAGAKAAFVFTAGFAEADADGRVLQERLVEVARRRGVHIAGPNGVGFLDADSRIAATFSPSIAWDAYDKAPGHPGANRTAIVAQSGGLAFSISLRGASRGLVFSKIISSGNEADLDAVDYLEHLIDDPGTGSIIMFLEAIRRGPEFMAAARRARAAGKSIVVTKVGRSQAGARSAASHTASLTGEDAVADAVFRACGVVRVDDIDELIDVTLAATYCPPAKGKRVGVVTVSGGTGGWMSDALSLAGLSVPEYSEKLQDELRSFLPSFAAVFNPVDVTAGATQNDHHVRSVETVAASDEVDAIIVISALSTDVGYKRQEERFRAVAAKASKPVVIFSYPQPMPGIVPWLAEMGYPVYTSLKGCARALSALAEWGAYVNVPARADAGLPLASATATELATGGQSLTEVESRRLLEPFGITGPAMRLVRTVDEAVAAAKSLGFPVALKIQSRDIAHKTEVGGVVLGIAGEAALREAFARIMESVRFGAPFASIQGMLVTRMAHPGLEVIAGIKNDPVFGPIVIVGLGGVHAEIFRDVASAPAPVSEAQVEVLLKSLKSRPLLDGYRGGEPRDVAALARMVAALSRFAIAHKEHVAEIDLNPVMVHGRGQGVSVCDALIVTKGKA